MFRRKTNPPTSRYVLFLVPTTTTEWCGVGEVTIDMLPDYVLLQTFSFCRETQFWSYRLLSPVLWWRPLVHVCRRWRQIVFSSPRSLHLLIYCGIKTSIRKSLDIWPPFLISVDLEINNPDEECENTVAALELRDRVSEVRILINCRAGGASVLERLTAAMLEPFPELSCLYLIYLGDTTQVLPDAFLGRFAPSLQSLTLVKVAFPALSALLLSTTRLTSLQLWGTPYISPEAIVTCLVALPNLEDVGLSFPPYPDHISSSFPKRATLPSLTRFHFRGVGEYSENLLARIDAPTLQTLSITFSDVVFRIPQLYRFLSCAQEFEPPSVVDMEFGRQDIKFTFRPSNNIRLRIECGHLTTQVSSIAAICRDLSPFLSHVERLDLHGRHLPWSPSWPGYSVPAGLDWLGLFHLFISVQSLYVSMNLGPFFIPALEELTKEGATAVFPKLRTFFLEELHPSRAGPVREAIEAFITARSLSDHPVLFQQRLHLDSDPGATISQSS